jgi:hypothetical protein
LPRDLKGGFGSGLLAIVSLCFGKLDDQLLRLNLDSCDVNIDEAPVVNLLRWFEMLANVGTKGRRCSSTATAWSPISTFSPKLVSWKPSTARVKYLASGASPNPAGIP